MDIDELKSKYEDMLDKFSKAVAVDVDNLGSEMAKNSALMYRIGLQKADAEALKNKLETAFERENEASPKAGSASFTSYCLIKRGNHRFRLASPII